MKDTNELTDGEALFIVCVLLPLVILRVVLTAFFVIHDGAAWLTLLLTRDWIVSVWDEELDGLFGDLGKRIFVLVWLFVIPVGLAYFWIHFPVLLFFLLPVSIELKRFLLIGSTVMVVACYFWRFFAQPPRSRNWPKFLAAQQQLVFALQCEYVMQRLKVGLKLADWWDSLKE